MTALSLGGLRRWIEALLMPESDDVRLVLDRAARLERDAACSDFLASNGATSLKV